MGRAWPALALRRWVLLLALAPCVACVRFHPQPLSPERTAAAYAARNLDNPGLRDYVAQQTGEALAEWPLPAWDLSHLTLAAFYYHPDLDVARAQWAVAQAGKAIARERPNPTLSTQAAYNTTTRTPSPWIPLAALSVPIETAGKRGHRVAQARHLSEAARLGIASVAWRVRGGVRGSLIALDAAREAQALLSEQQELNAENVRLLEAQHDAGAISGFELTQARVAADSAQLAWRDAQRKSGEALVQLADALGLPASALGQTTLSFDELDVAPAELSLSEARGQALTSRADILAALEEYAASQSALKLEVAKQYPDIQLGPGYEFDQGNDKWSLALTLPLPLVSRNRAGISEAEARRSESAARFEALQARVLAEIDRALAGYEAARAQRTAAEALLGKLRHQEQTARAMLEAGEIGKADLIGLRLQASAAALGRVEAIAASRQALAALESALEQPLGMGAQAWQQAPRATPPSNGHR
jgi:outer membrane protein, heavy metal efflux system